MNQISLIKLANVIERPIFTKNTGIKIEYPIALTEDWTSLYCGVCLIARPPKKAPTTALKPTKSAAQAIDKASTSDPITTA